MHVLAHLPAVILSCLLRFPADLWLQYIREELGPLGQPENCGKIHWRAMKFLEGESVERFTSKYTLLQTGHLWVDWVASVKGLSVQPVCSATVETLVSWRSSTISEKLLLLLPCPSMNCFNAFNLESWCCLLPSRRKGPSILLQTVPVSLRRNVSGDCLQAVPTKLFHL